MKKKKPVREAVLDAAIDLVETSAAGLLTLDAVAARAGVSKGGLLHHFNTKEALLKAMMGRVTDNFEQDAKTTAEQLHAGSGNSSRRQLDLLTKYLKRSFSGAGARDHSAMALFAVAAHQPDLVEPIRDYYSRRAKDTIENADNPAAALALMMLADGLWLFDALDIAPFKGKLREQVQEVALQWAKQAVGQTVESDSAVGKSSSPSPTPSPEPEGAGSR